MVTGVVTLWLSCIVADLAERLARSSIARSSIARVVHLARHCFKTWFVAWGWCAVYLKMKKYFNFFIHL
jgi:hypothetical protein